MSGQQSGRIGSDTKAGLRDKSFPQPGDLRPGKGPWGCWGLTTEG